MCFEFEILADDHEVESDFLSEALQSFLNLLLSKGNPIFGIFIFSNQNGAWLESIQFVEVAIMGHIAHKVVDVSFFLLLAFILFENEGLGPAKTIMDFADGVGVTKGETFVFGRQVFCELVEVFEASFNGDGGIKKYWEDGLGGAGVVDDLSGKEEILIVIL